MNICGNHMIHFLDLILVPLSLIDLKILRKILWIDRISYQKNTVDW